MKNDLHLQIMSSFIYNISIHTKFSDFFLKSEGKEIERKRKKRDVGGGGGYLLTYFWG